jgi:hypothetical protein
MRACHLISALSCATALVACDSSPVSHGGAGGAGGSSGGSAGSPDGSAGESACAADGTPAANGGNGVGGAGAVGASGGGGRGGTPGIVEGPGCFRDNPKCGASSYCAVVSQNGSIMVDGCRPLPSACRTCACLFQDLNAAYTAAFPLQQYLGGICSCSNAQGPLSVDSCDDADHLSCFGA